MRVRGKHIACGLLALAVAAPLAAQSLDGKIKNKQSELKSIQRKINEHRAEAKKLNQQESAMLSKITNLDQEIELAQQFLQNLQDQEHMYTVQIDSLKSAIDSESGLLEEQREALAGRLRQMYMQDPANRWDVVLGASSVNTAVERYRYMKLIAAQDAGLIDSFRDRRLQLQTEQATLTEALSEIALVRQTREEEAVRLDDAKRERKTMLTQIRRQKSQKSKAIKDLQRAQKEVTDLIGRLEAKRDTEVQGSGEFAKLRGQLPLPMDGKIIRGYGQRKHPRYGTVTFNNGVDILGKQGDPIMAVADGTVEFVDWIDAFGRCIIINHGDGYYTLYAHVSTTYVSQGNSIGAGEVIAEVGDTGALNGFTCHFEIRQGKKALDPAGWFRK